MKTVELSEETHAALLRLARARHLSPGELIATLVAPAGAAPAADRLTAYLADDAFNRLTDASDRYLALLAWCAQNHAADFADFIAHQESGRRYLTWDRAEINEARVRNQARPIAGSPFWAVMTIDDETRRDFIHRLLEFIGCPDATLAAADRALGFAPPPTRRFRLLSA